MKRNTSEYKLAHTHLAKARGKASSCVWGCTETYRYEWANLTGNYADFDDYAAMCMTCHRRYDFAVKSLQGGSGVVRTHGTRAMYGAGKCRCEECTWANTLYNREHRARKIMCDS